MISKEHPKQDLLGIKSYISREITIGLKRKIKETLQPIEKKEKYSFLDKINWVN